ncbi:hypothetical protein HK105_206163 [Polyrhizophydium stewartii]|uniref:Uncharacterized protein n=1 Tax=Polyrhizophydium stewartii TaxID=2732419 RepID=A0ABR4N4C3_9FUNG|nr:hypothetical protein HK105_002160 [Polyrhizophydium stewartii]
MHGLWYERTWLDLGREAIIHAVLSLLYVPAWHIKCASSVAIVTLIGLQHLASLFVHPDGFLPTYAVLPGAVALGLLGYTKGSRLLFFVGLYSFVSKYNFIRWVPASTRAGLGSYADTTNELLKLAAATALWAAFAFWLPRPALERLALSAMRRPLPRRLLRSDTRAQYPRPVWFSELAWLLPASTAAGWLPVTQHDDDTDGEGGGDGVAGGSSSRDPARRRTTHDAEGDLELGDLNAAQA